MNRTTSLAVLICTLAAPALAQLPTVSAANFVSLQAAVNSIAGTGGTVLVPCGTYTTTTISSSNITLNGAGPCAIITAAASGTSNILTVTSNALATVIENLQVQGQAVDETTIQRCIYLTGGSSGTLIDHVTFSGTTGSNGCNIQIHSDSTSSGNTISHNTLTQAIGTINTGYGVLLETSANNVVKFNSSIQSATQGRHHIYLSAGASANLVTNNVLNSGADDQIDIYALDTQRTCQYNTIQNNTLHGAGSNVGGEAAIHLAQNVTHNTISNNTIWNSTISGIEVEASATLGQSHADANYIQANQIYFAGEFGIEILGSSSNIIQDNTIYESSQNSTNGYPGIEVSSDGVNAVAQNNRIFGNSSVGSQMQRNGLQIDSGSPQPVATTAYQNCFGVGAIGNAVADGGSGSVLTNNNLTCTINPYAIPSD